MEPLDNTEPLKNSLSDLWKEVIPKESQLVVIHSSLFHFRLPLEDLKEVLINSIIDLSERGLTVALPAFTFSFCKGTPYHFKNSLSETGIWADWLFQSGKAKRTPHPIYSFVVIGPLSDKIMECKNKTTFGEDSSFEYFENHRTVFVMFGCGWEYCTQLHRTEEQLKVPYRFYKEFSGFADFEEGSQKKSCRMYVHNLEIGSENDFTSVVDTFRKSGKLKSVPFYKGRVESMASHDLKPICLNLLEKDPFVWVKNKKLVMDRLLRTV